MSKESIEITEDYLNSNNEYEVVMTPGAIPDLNVMSEHIINLLNYIESPDMVEMENSYLNEYDKINVLKEKEQTIDTKRKIIQLKKIANKKKEKYENLIYGKFNSVLPMKIISLLVEQERYDNLNELLDMFDILKDVKNGKKDINIEAEKFGEKNRTKFVYPKFGGKDQFFKEMNTKK